jgi:hypothetical protein
LTGWLSDNNLKGGVRFPLALFSDQSVNPAIFSWDALLESGCFPFVKRRLLNIRYPFVFSFKRLSPLLKKNGYPEDLIVKYAKRLNIKIKNM